LLFYCKSILNRFLGEEIIVVTSKELIITQKLFYFKRQSKYLNRQIKHLRCLGRDNYINNINFERKINYPELENLHRENNFLLSEGRVSFFYCGYNVQFGQDISQEDGEVLLNLVLCYM